jgi:NAD(P)-dependent dehydrogenase (short-subunit alcohol dehydrogenase family)
MLGRADAAQGQDRDRHRRGAGHRQGVRASLRARRARTSSSADIRAEQAEAVAAECSALGPAALGARVDVSDEASTKALAERTVERFGRVDVLVNNAAIYYDMDRTENSLAYFNRVLSVNLTGAWLMTRAVERFMKRQRKGKIIHQSSTAAYMGNVGMVDTDEPGDARCRHSTTASPRSASPASRSTWPAPSAPGAST